MFCADNLGKSARLVTARTHFKKDVWTRVYLLFSTSNLFSGVLNLKGYQFLSETIHMINKARLHKAFLTNPKRMI